VTTARITHATPGALYAHIQNRDWESDSAIPEIFRNKNCHDIAHQLVHSDAGQKANVRKSVLHVTVVNLAVVVAVVVDDDVDDDVDVEYDFGCFWCRHWKCYYFLEFGRLLRH